MKTSCPALVVAALISFCTQTMAQSASRSNPTAFFETKIRPVLVDKCYQCHAETSSNIRGGLVLDTREGIRRGGDTGPAIVPGDLKKSLLIEAIRYTDRGTAMPPEKHGGKLPDAVIADFEQWVKMGAPDPRDGKAAIVESSKKWDPQAAKSWWAFQPLRTPTVPELKNMAWPRGDIDRFVLAGLEEKGLKPVDDADKVTLLRRVYFDLVGLPPAPEKITAFVADKSPKAFEKVVDELLASPQFGERWGRHWLDVARYAESTGKDLNVSFPHAWRYRDYVIAAFNKDKPYDQFIREQIAGDLLPAKDPKVKAEQQIATGFLAIGPKNLGELTPRQFELDLADEQIDATTQAFLGLTVACARCHDHKFDPISQRDYYALAGIFLSTEVSYGTLSGPKNNQEREVVTLPKEAGLPTVHSKITPQERARLAADFAAAKSRYDDLMAQRSTPGPRSGPGSKGSGESEKTGGSRESGATTGGMEGRGERGGARGGRSGMGGARGGMEGRSGMVGPKGGMDSGGMGGARGGSGPQFFIQVQIALGRMAESENLLNAFDEQGNPKAFCMGVQDRPASKGRPEPMRSTKVVEIKGSSGIRPPSGFESIADSPLFERGEMNEPTDRVPRGFPAAIFSSTHQGIPLNTSGRKQLADWIVDERHPLTSRVMANRMWHWLFGEGLVTTVDNFGTTGALPANQALLDHLATRLVKNHWSMKTTIREIVLSRTYQLTSTYDAENFAADPENTLLWRHSKLRLDAECIRDAMLAASGQLNLKPPVGSIVSLAGEGPIGSTGGFVRINEDDFINATANYRSVYLPIARDLLPDALAVFDYSEASIVNGAREQTNVPAQALYLLNNDFVIQQANQFAQRLGAKSSTNIDQRISQAYALAFSRQPTKKEVQAAKSFLNQQNSNGNSSEKAWSTFLLALFASAEFRFLD